MLNLVSEVNEMDFKTKTAYKNAMAKVYDKTIAEYLKSSPKLNQQFYLYVKEHNFRK